MATSNVWMQVAVMALMIIGIGVIVFLPAMIFLLRMKEVSWAIGAYFGYPLLVAFGFIAIGSAVTGDIPPGEAIFSMLWGGFVFTATVGSPLFVWRACGYRLVWPRDRKPQPGEAIGS